MNGGADGQMGGGETEDRWSCNSFTSVIHLGRRAFLTKPLASHPLKHSCVNVRVWWRPLLASDAFTLLYFSFCLSHLLQIMGKKVLDEREER